MSNKKRDFPSRILDSIRNKEDEWHYFCCEKGAPTKYYLRHASNLRDPIPSTHLQIRGNLLSLFCDGEEVVGAFDGRTSRSIKSALNERFSLNQH